MQKAIVLLGFRNAGKDSTCKALQKKYTNVYNAKFGAYNKYLAAKILNVPVELMEYKSWREDPISDKISFTTLDLLNALFCFSANNVRLQSCIDSWCLDSIPDDTVVVFTDIRRKRELHLVFSKFADVDMYYLEPESACESEGDEEINDIIGMHAFKIKQFIYAPVDETAAIIAQNTPELVDKNQKPILHLIATGAHPYFTQYDRYEPLLSLYLKCKDFLTDVKADREIVGKLFDFVYPEIPTEDLDFPDVVKTSVMRFVPEQHIDLVQKMREKATLLLHVPKNESGFIWVTSRFSPEEINEI